MVLPTPPDEDEVGSWSKARTRRTFDLNTDPPSAPPTPLLEPIQTSWPTPDKNHLSESNTNVPTKRNRSFQNLTSSTLSGIYKSTIGSFERDESSTPWGPTGTSTPQIGRSASFDISTSNMSDFIFRKGPDGSVSAIRKGSRHIPNPRPRKSLKTNVLPLLGRQLALFGFGVLYSMIISHLHDKRGIAPVKLNVDRSEWSYILFWGTLGALLGELLPRAQRFWPSSDEGKKMEEPEPEDEEDQTAASIQQLNRWNEVVRSIGAFIGIAFAIRKLPWHPTLQLSLTLSLANPAIWYLVDRSPSGFILSAIFAVTGTAGILYMNSHILPRPTPADILYARIWEPATVNSTWNGVKSDDILLGIFSVESVGAATWIASVLFVSSICFGNIGRLLAPPSR